MNGSHVGLGGTAATLLAQAIVYLTHWPWQPMTFDQASTFAGLTVLFFGGGGIGIFNLRRENSVKSPPS